MKLLNISTENLNKISGGKKESTLVHKVKEEAKTKISDNFEEHDVPHVSCHGNTCRWVD